VGRIAKIFHVRYRLTRSGPQANLGVQAYDKFPTSAKDVA